jgi:hypothetical protein
MSALVVPTKKAIKGISDVLKSVALTAVEVVNVLYSPFALTANTVGAIGSTLAGDSRLFGGETEQKVEPAVTEPLVSEPTTSINTTPTATIGGMTSLTTIGGGRKSRSRKIKRSNKKTARRSKSRSRSKRVVRKAKHRKLSK